LLIASKACSRRYSILQEEVHVPLTYHPKLLIHVHAELDGTLAYYGSDPKMTIIGRLCPALPLFAVALFISSWSYIVAISDFINGYVESITVDSVVNQTSSSLSTSDTSAIFFNAFFAPENEEHGLRIVREQLDQIASSYITSLKDRQVTVYFNTIGSPILNATLLNQLCGTRNMTCQLLNHYQSAFEEVTLQSLYDFCQDQDDESLRVVYLHNKGSFHSRVGNERWRRHLTAAAMNEHCLNPPNDTCNICGLQFWPVGGVPFFPGNMWTAKCSYVQKLLPPSGFETQMESVLKKAIDLQNEGRIVNGIYAMPRNTGLGATRTFNPAMFLEVFQAIFSCGLERFTMKMNSSGQWPPTTLYFPHQIIGNPFAVVKSMKYSKPRIAACENIFCCPDICTSGFISIT
jgi:hypothetical protein